MGIVATRKSNFPSTLTYSFEQDKPGEQDRGDDEGAWAVESWKMETTGESHPKEVPCKFSASTRNVMLRNF